MPATEWPFNPYKEKIMSRIEGAVNNSSVLFFRQLNGLEKESLPMDNVNINDLTFINSDGGDSSPKRTLTPQETLILAILNVYLLIFGVPPDQAAQGETPDTLIQKLEDHLLETNNHPELEENLAWNELIAAMMAHHAEIEEKGDFNPSFQLDKKIAPVNRNGGNPVIGKDLYDFFAHFLEVKDLTSSLAAVGEMKETILQKMKSFYLEVNDHEGWNLINARGDSILSNHDVAASLKKAC